MSMVRKLPPHVAKDLREFLSENNISTKKLVIDLEAETIEEIDDYSVDDILSVAGILKPGEAQELLDNIQKSREGWGKMTSSHSGYLFDSNIVIAIGFLFL